MVGGARTALPEPIAPRLRTPTWRDPRLLFGILLIAGSVVLGSWAISAGQKTVGIYQVTETITPGTTISHDNLAVVQVRGSDVQTRYLMAADGVPDGQVALRVLGEGEFVPTAALGETQAMTQRPIAIPVGSDLSSSVEIGSLVDLWFVPEAPARGTAVVSQSEGVEEAQNPFLLAKSLIVSEISAESGLIAGSAGSVHVLVPEEDLADVLGALSGQGSVSLVPGFGVER